MASSSVEICNSALIKLGAATITSLNDGNKSAKLCKAQYDRLRKEVLRSHPWNFAISRIEIAKTVNTPVYKYSSEFLLPSDCLRVLATSIDSFSIPDAQTRRSDVAAFPGEWEVEVNADGNKVIVCDATELKIKYVKDVTNTTLFDSSFEEALAYRIAQDLAFPLVQSTSMAQLMNRGFKDMISEARSFNAQENSLEEWESNEWIDVRI